jgi:hypothetical protein
VSALLNFIPASIKSLEPYCSEFLIHAADNEGLQKGIDELLVEKLAQWCSIPVTYAGGGRNLQDLDHVKRLSNGKVDLTIGSALDIFGGSGVAFEECVAWNKSQLIPYIVHRVAGITGRVWATPVDLLRSLPRPPLHLLYSPSTVLHATYPKVDDGPCFCRGGARTCCQTLLSTFRGCRSHNLLFLH